MTIGETVGDELANVWSRSEEECLLREFAHRAGNEVASALAALHLLGRASTTGPSAKLLSTAIARLEGFGGVLRLLSAPVRKSADVGASLNDLVSGLIHGRPDLAGSVVALSSPSIMVDGLVARRMALIGAEVVMNAINHALHGRKGRLNIALKLDEDDLELMVNDDGPGIRSGSSSAGTGWGSGIVAELAARARGTIEVTSGPSGTNVLVRLPIRPEVEAGDVF